MAPYGKIKADAIIWDNSGSDAEESLSSIGQKATLTGDTFTGHLLIDNEKELRLGEPDASGANYTGLKAQAQSGDITLTLPAVAPTANQVLKADASTPTTLTWASDVALTLIDEDNMASDSATAVPSQQSVKAYVDAGDLSLIDEDDLASDSATRPPSQQSVKAYSDTKLPIAGGTLTGALTLSGDPTASYHAAPKTYVDTQAVAGGVFSNDVEFGQGKGIKWDSDNSNIYEITLKGPNTLTADANYVWPSADGSSGQSLTTNGSGQFAWSTVGDASLASDQNWTGAQRGTITDIGSVSSGALNIDLSASNNHKVASSGTPVFTFTNFGASGEALGQSGTITVTHTGSGVPTWNGHCNFAGGLASAPTITADATTVLSYYVFEATNNTTGKVLVEGLSAVSAA